MMLLKKVLRDFLLSKNTKEYPVIITGMAQGADMIGYNIAQRNGLEIKKFPANWDSYGKEAGIIRNKQMAEYAHKQGNGVLIAFWDGKSKGTKNMIQNANVLNLEVYVYDFNGNLISIKN